MRLTPSIALVATGLLLLSGCAGAPAELPGEPEPGTNGTDAPAETMAPGLDPAECFPGTWRVDNAAQLENMLGYDSTLTSLTGSATVAFGDESLNLQYDSWKWDADIEGAAYSENRSGSNSGSYQLVGMLLEPVFQEFDVQLTIEFDGERSTDEEDVEGVELLGTVYCYADSLVIETDVDERTYLVPAN